MASKLFKVSGQTSRSLVLTTQCAKANNATDEDQLQWIRSLFSYRQIDLGLSEIERENTNDAMERIRALRNLLSQPLNISQKSSNHERQLIKRYDLYYHLSLPNFNPTQAGLEHRLASHDKIILLVIHIGK